MPAPTERRVLVTGATGFVGGHLVPRLQARGWHVTAGVRRPGQRHAANAELVLGDLRHYGDADLSGFEAVVHLAARVHDHGATAEDLWRENVAATETLGRNAARAHIRLLVFLSTVKVFGEGRPKPYSTRDAPSPQGAYAGSKWEAEQRLAAIPGLAVAVIRPPLVHGPDSRANMQALLSLSAHPIPLPFSRVHNRRSLVAIDNLCALIEMVLWGHPGTYTVRDGYDPSTPGLISAIRRIGGTADPQVPVPSAVLRRLLGPARAPKLLGSLTVDDRATREALGWIPEVTFEQGLHTTVTGHRRPRRLLMLVTEDWYFWSHRSDLARAAVEAGWQVHLACRVADHRERIEKLGVVVHPLQWSRAESVSHSMRQLPQLVALYRQILPDIAHHVAVKPVVLGALAAGRTGVPVVINALAGTGSALAGQTTSAVLLRAGVKRALQDPHQWLVVQNPDDQRYLAPWTRPGRSVLIPGSGVDVSQFAPTPEAPGRTRIALVCRMLRSKGPADAVAAVTTLRSQGHGVELLLVGDTDPDSNEAIPRQTLQRWGELPGITWTGRTDNVAAVWREAHIAVLPSTYGEGLPKALLEAGACGRPLVAYDNAGVRDLVIDGVTGILVPPGDVSGLTESLAQLVADGDLRRRLGVGASEIVRKSYSNDVILTTFLQLYDNALGLGPDGRS